MNRCIEITGGFEFIGSGGVEEGRVNADWRFLDTTGTFLVYADSVPELRVKLHKEVKKLLDSGYEVEAAKMKQSEVTKEFYVHGWMRKKP